ncbi:TetR/AcrR family transcriptional regulator [Labedaea rhizosphaerae]|uniref:TetR family transcriptional regulator n=1 Tax=Labedaea rhizosphaerae TaxID=598644 RepID=A0A4R6SCM4_LABRH|nr:TetR/AcrR family transcriptional regulator [Labedaea rhizosphaerae]TDP97353.1 TetR family transcriptional regulator [Labedaea rhizosphaerae]
MGRREANRERMRTRLLEAALALFAERGYEATTITDIAERADVARQTVLNHYPHKRDFVLAWGASRRDRIAEQARLDGPAAANLHRFFAAFARMNEDERELTRALHIGPRADEARVYQWPVADAVVAAVERGIEDGEFAADLDARAAAEVVTAVYFDTLTRWLVDGPPPFDLGAALAARLDLVLTGLATRGSVPRIDY